MSFEIWEENHGERGKGLVVKIETWSLVVRA